MPGTPNPATRAADEAALTNVQWAAIVALASVFLSLITLFSDSYGSLLTVSSPPSGTSSVTIGLAALYLLIATAGVSVILLIIELVLYRNAFRTLAPLDSRFSTPGTLVLLLLIALVLVIVVGVALIAVVFQAIACAGSGNPITTSCLHAGTILGLVAGLVIVAIVALVGFIGLLIGIWRLGSRYDETLFKVGAILLIFPVLNFIGVILILVGARSARSRLAPPVAPMGPATFG